MLLQWSAFVEACDAGSIRAAAERSGFSQPGLSRQIAALERTMGVRLLTRGSRGVSPTPAGLALLPHARLVVNEVRRGAQAAAQAGTGSARALSVGAVPSVSASLLPRALGILAHTDGPSCTVVTALSPRLTSMVLDRELDAAVVTDAPPGPPRDPGLSLQHLMDDEMVVITSGHSARTSRRRADLSDFAAHTWIEDNAGSEAMLRGLAARAGFEPVVSTVADGLLTKTGLVAAELGIALVPGVLVPALRGDLQVVRLREPATRGIYLLARSERRDLEELTEALAAAVDPAR